MDESQHKDGYPWTWEPAAATALLLLTIVVLSLQLGRAAALLVTGAGAWWPTNDHLVTSTWGILQGNLTAGLPDTTTTASPVLAWVLAGIIATALTIAVGWGLWRIRDASLHKGMATTAEAQQLLGIQRLRQNRRLIRPDLHNKDNS